MFDQSAKKASLVDVGVVGGSDEREKGPQTSYFMGQAMGSGSGLGKSTFQSAPKIADEDFFSSLGSQSYQYGGFQK